MKILRRNVRLFNTSMFFHSTIFALPVLVLFGVNHLRLSYERAGSFIWVITITVLAFDFLGGLIADRFGRKLAYVVGMVLQMAGFGAFAFLGTYPLILIGPLAIGAGSAIESNSLNALLFEQAVSLDAEHVYQRANGLVSMFGFAGRSASSVVGGFLFTLSPTLPFWLTAVTLGISLVAGGGMKFGTGAVREPSAKRQQLFRTALRAYHCNPTLLKFVAITGITDLFITMLFSYYQPLYIGLGVSAQTLGVIMAVVALLSGLSSLAMQRLSRVCSAQIFQAIIALGGFLSALAIGLLPMPLILGAPLFLAVVSGFITPNLRYYVNSQAPDRVRVSVLSLASSVSSLGSLAAQVLVFSLVGHVASVALIGFIGVGCGLALVVSILSAHHSWRSDGVNLRLEEDRLAHELIEP